METRYLNLNYFIHANHSIEQQLETLEDFIDGYRLSFDAFARDTPKISSKTFVFELENP